MIILGFIVILACIYWAYFAAKSWRMDRITSNIPVPPGLPIVGHALLFLGGAEKMLENITYIANIAIKQNGVVKIWLGPRMYTAIANPEDAQVVLDNCLDKDGVYRFMQPWLGHGLFVAPLNLWKCHRKVMLPLFNNKVIVEFVSVIAEQATVMVDRLLENAGKGEFDIHKYTTACALDIMFETAMGERMNVQRYPDTPYLRARNTVMTILNMRLFKVWLQPDCLFNLTSYAKEQKHNIDLTHKFTDEVVKKRRVEYEKSKDDPSVQFVAEGKLKAVLDLLFGREIEFTDEQLREQIDSITIAGNDTTALAISYTLVLLGIHEDSQQRVIQEQREIFGESKRGANKDDIHKMHYLERVIKESMRLYTVVPIIARNIQKDTYLPSSGVTLPAGSGAVVGAFAMHRSEKVWGADASQYDPDRFLPERSLDRHPAAFLPFSYGSRNCIGRNFGMIIMKSIISSVIRSYKIEADDVGPLKIEMLLFPINGHLVKIYKRESEISAL